MAVPISVLVVDEDAAVLDLTATFLERVDPDLEVLTEADPAAAIERVAEGTVDCVVSDYRMPDMDGLELYEAMVAERPIPFVLVSAAVDDDVRDAGEAAGVTAVIEKDAGTEHYTRLAEEIRAAVDA